MGYQRERRAELMIVCGQQRVREMESIAAGAQEIAYTCENNATEKVLLNDEVHDMCPQCASDAINEFSAIEIKKAQESDAAQLRQYADIMHTGAEIWASRPTVAKWFADCGIQLECMAVDILEGKL
jgi:hypothetical protein